MFSSKFSKNKKGNSGNNSKNSFKKKKKLYLSFWRIVILFFLLAASLYAIYIFFFKKPEIIEIFPDDSIIKIKAKIDNNFNDLIKKDSVIYDMIMKKKETENKKTRLSESTEDPMDIIAKSHGNNNLRINNTDIFRKYSCIDQSKIHQESLNLEQKPLEQNEHIASSPQSKEYSFKITEINELQNNDKNTKNKQSNFAEKLKFRKKQKYFYCDLNYFYDKTQAEKEYAKLRYIYAKIISPYQYTIHSKQKDDKYVYVLSIGKFDKFEEARSLCRRLIIQKQNCMVNQWQKQ